MSLFDKVLLNNAIDAVLDEHVAATRSQRVQMRDLLLDGIEAAGFEIKFMKRVTPKDYAPVAGEDVATRAARNGVPIQTQMAVDAEDHVRMNQLGFDAAADAADWGLGGRLD